MSIIPESSPVHKQLHLLARDARIVIFSGLPGIGKSLYINEFYSLAIQEKREVTVIQWDVARKAFETEKIMERYPMGDGTVHNGMKLLAGAFIRDKILKWSEESRKEDLLLIEAPLVGHRFIEVAELSDDPELEEILADESCSIIVPIPSKKVRKLIEEERARQVDEDAKVWMGAKPSVMIMLWRMVYNIALEFGYDAPADDNPEYDPEVIEFVFRQICKHRHFVPLHIDEVFTVPEQSESELHKLESVVASKEEAESYFDTVSEAYPHDEMIDQRVEAWYHQ
ncbi:MAG: hypothetical protein KJO29_02895 [Bacteroidia bacterium]|nr:hypothetical protein [Bacteroidia bacterium]